MEFSERKNTALWNTKVAEDKALSVAEHLAVGCTLKATARLAKVHQSGVTRLNRKVGHHAKAFHDEQVWDMVSPVGSIGKCLNIGSTSAFVKSPIVQHGFLVL